MLDQLQQINILQYIYTILNHTFHSILNYEPTRDTVQAFRGHDFYYY